MTIGLALCVPASGILAETTAKQAQDMIAHATKAIANAKDAGVEAERIKELSDGLAMARKALDAGKFEEARARARSLGGDADEARSELTASKRVRFTVTVGEKTGTHFNVDKGSVEVKSAGVKTTVKGGEAVKVVKGVAPTRVNLLKAPKPTSPTNGKTIYQRVKLSWEPVQGASMFGVDVAAEPDFHRRIMVGKTENKHLELPDDMENGAYWWRVVAIQPDGTFGHHSRAHRFDYAAGEDAPTVRVGKPVWGDN